MPNLWQKPVERASARMAPLAMLPVFFDLKSKAVTVAGGTAAAAWKAELLAAAGANVTVYAPEASPEIQDLIANSLTVGRIAYVPSHVTAAAMQGSALVVADAGCKDDAASLVAMAKIEGVPINVIDRPTFCDCQFGSIVNRSPIVIGISTDGAAPILGKAIRQRIETLLPPSLAGWADYAKRIRKTVMDTLTPGIARAQFWERFAERAFTQPPPAANGVHDLLQGIQGPTTGHVTLVGAGPGTAEFLTLQALRALQSADIILFDDLVSDEVLELARREAKRMLVGKRGRRASCRQDDINDLMVKLANQGKHVVRLKSGDPMVFGRAGEEIARLEAEGISVTVVPGITAASALASRLGVSLTHRDFAQSVRFVTGHSRQGRLPDDIDWQSLADPHTTTIVYMGGHTAADISDKLIEAGLAAHAPVVVASDVARPGEAWTDGRLDSLGRLVSGLSSTGPILIGIGEVFRSVNTSKMAETSSSFAKALPAAGHS